MAAESPPSLGKRWYLTKQALEIFQKALFYFCLFVRLSVGFSVCLSVYLSVSPSLFQSLSLLMGMFLLILSVCLAVCLCFSFHLFFFLPTPVHVHTCLSVLAPVLHCGPTPRPLDFSAAAAASSAGDSRASAATEPAPFIGAKSPSTDRRLITRTVSKTRLLRSETDNI